MSKSALQQRSQENQVAISRVEEMKADELGDVVRKLYGDVVRVKVRPSKQHLDAVTTIDPSWRRQVPSFYICITHGLEARAADRPWDGRNPARFPR